MQQVVVPPDRQALLSKDLSALAARPWYLFFQAIEQAAQTASGIVQYDARAQRLALNTSLLVDGSLFLEEDTGLVYQWREQTMQWAYVLGTMVGTFAARLTGLATVDTGVLYETTDTFQLYQWNGSAWKLFTQMYSRTQAQLATFAGTLGASDAGLLVDVSDYGHVLQWTGSAWSWGPGEQGSGMLQAFAVAPTGPGWHACDGTVGVTYLKADGTTGTLTVPNTAATAAYMKAGGAYAAAISAATVPTISQPTFAGAAMGTHAHEVPIGVAGTSLVSFGNLFGVGPSRTDVGYAVMTANSTPQTTSYSNTTSAGTPAGTVSQPAATLPADPVANFEALLYFRQ